MEKNTVSKMIRSNPNKFSKVISNDQVVSYNISQRARASASGLALPNEDTAQDSFKAISNLASGLTKSIQDKEVVIAPPVTNGGINSDAKHGGFLGWLNNGLDSIFGHDNLKRMDAGVNGVIDGVGNALGDFKNYAILAGVALVLILLFKK
jgi:hypothetical protein